MNAERYKRMHLGSEPERAREAQAMRVREAEMRNRKAQVTLRCDPKSRSATVDSEQPEGRCISCSWALSSQRGLEEIAAKSRPEDGRMLKLKVCNKRGYAEDFEVATRLHCGHCPH
jgi:hypothetical protein